MLRIAICDDDEMTCQDLKKKITKTAQAEQIQKTIEIFYTEIGLRQALAEEQYDLIFLEVSLPENRGLEISHYIRKEQKNHIVQIVYMSKELIDVMPFFEMHPLHFLIKPISQKNINEILPICNTLIHRFDNHFAFRSGRELRRVTAKDVLYIESKGRHIHIHTRTGTQIFNGKMNELLDSVKDLPFLRIYNSIAVNCRYIEAVTPSHIFLAENIKLPISQSKKAEVQEWLQSHTRKENNH